MKKVPVWKTVILIVAVWVVILIATFAWFVTGPKTWVNDMIVHVGEASYIQISGNGGNDWAEDLEVEISVKQDFKEMSGNGTDLFTPVYDIIEAEDGSISPAITAFEKVTDDRYYFEQLFAFQSDANYNVYLDPVSGVTSKDGFNIEGAIRVAFFEVDANNNEILKCIWAPNSTVEYSASTNSFVTDGNPQPAYYYQKSTQPVDKATLEAGKSDPNMAMISAVDPEDPETALDCGYDAANKFMWSNGEELPEDAPVMLAFRLAEGQKLAMKKMKIRVWLEGHDNECVSQLLGQQFTMRFKFTAEKESDK